MARIGPTVVLQGPATASWEALGTTALVQVVSPDALATATATLDRQLRELDVVASRFRDDSELCALNRRAGHPTAVSPLLAELIAQALRAAQISDGIVNPALGWALTAVGYDRDFAEVLSREESGWGGFDGGGRSLGGGDRDGALQVVAHRQDWRSIELDLSAGTVLLPAGMSLDLGATAKAYAADRAATEIAAQTGVGTLISLGGDIACAGTAPEAGWDIFVTDDHRAPVGAFGQLVAIDSGALATSSTTVRSWRRDGRIRHHIVDPRTGESTVGPWRTISATAQTCVDANIATTGALVLGAEGLRWLESAGIAARLVAHDGSVVYSGGWPEAAR